MAIHDCDKEGQGDEDDKNIARYTMRPILSWLNPKQ